MLKGYPLQLKQLPDATNAPRFVQLEFFNENGDHYYYENQWPIEQNYFGLADLNFGHFWFDGDFDEYGNHLYVVEYSRFQDGENNLIYNTNYINVPEGAASVKVYFFYNSSQGSDVYHRNDPTEIVFVDAADAFKVENYNGKTCQTFDDFNISIGPDELDGFCGLIENITVMKHPNDIIDPLDENNSLGIVNEDAYNQSLGDWGEHCDDLSTTTTGETTQTSPDPVPGGCKTFVLSYEIWPCPEMAGSEDCPPLLIEEEITICCQCDTRTQISD